MVYLIYDSRSITLLLIFSFRIFRVCEDFQEESCIIRAGEEKQVAGELICMKNQVVLGIGKNTLGFLFISSMLEIP